jgi:hypothetical protein
MLTFGWWRTPLGPYGATGVCRTCGEHPDWIVVNQYAFFRLLWFFGIRGRAYHTLLCARCKRGYRARGPVEDELRARYGPPGAELRDTIGLVLFALAALVLLPLHPDKTGLGLTLWVVFLAIIGLAMAAFGRHLVPVPLRPPTGPPSRASST